MMDERTNWIIDHILNRTVLDIGCVGNYPKCPISELLHYRIKSCSRSVLGIDINKKGIKELKLLDFNVAYADAETYLSEQKYEAVVLAASLEHMDNVGSVLDCSRKNLKKNGMLIITTPNARYLGVALRDMTSDYHNLIYSPKLLATMLKKHKFKVIETEFFNYPNPAPNIIGWLYEKIFTRLFPKMSSHFGVVAKKVR